MQKNSNTIIPVPDLELMQAQVNRTCHVVNMTHVGYHVYYEKPTFKDYLRQVGRYLRNEIVVGRKVRKMLVTMIISPKAVEVVHSMEDPMFIDNDGNEFEFDNLINNQLFILSTVEGTVRINITDELAVYERH